MKKKGFKIMSIGCSFTEGIGVNDTETWPHQFTNLIPNAVDMNFGTGGRSNDFVARCLLTYYDLIKPDLVLIMYTNPQRREIYTKDNGVEPFMPTASWGWMGFPPTASHRQRATDFSPRIARESTECMTA